MAPLTLVSNHVTHSFGGHPSPFSARFLGKYFMVAQAGANCDLSLQLNEIHVAFSQFSSRAKIITVFFVGSAHDFSDNIFRLGGRGKKGDKKLAMINHRF